MLLKYVFEKNQTWKEYYIRTTDLESFINCPYNYKFREFNFNNYETFYIGKVLHTYIQHYIIRWWDEDKKLLQDISKWLPSSLLSYLLQAKKILDENFDKKDYTVITMERSLMINFELAEGNIILEWTIDLVLTNWHSKIVDIKTANSKWSDGMLNLKHQSTIYSVLYNLAQKKTTGEQEFEYWIFTKQATMQFQRIQKKVNIADALLFVRNKLSEYIQAEQNNMRWVNKSIQCGWCSLKKHCPAYQETLF